MDEHTLDKELNNVGKQLEQAKEQKNDRKRLCAGCIQLLAAACVLGLTTDDPILSPLFSGMDDTFPASFLLCPVIAGILLKFALVNLRKTAPVILYIGMVAEAVILGKECLDFAAKHPVLLAVEGIAVVMATEFMTVCATIFLSLYGRKKYVKKGENHGKK